MNTPGLKARRAFGASETNKTTACCMRRQTEWIGNGRLRVQTRVENNKRGGGTKTMPDLSLRILHTSKEKSSDVKDIRNHECNDKHWRYTKKGMSGLQMAIVILAQRRDSKTSGNHSRRIKNLHEQVVQHALHLHKCDLLRARQNSPTTMKLDGEIK